MKHVGMNVAADALMTLAYIGTKGGLVILTADDPFMFSSQNEQDNRYYGKLSGLSILEPSSVQEAKEMTTYAFELSEMLGEPVILRTTTRINHSTAVVSLGDIRQPVTKGEFIKDPMNLVCVPAVSRKLHVKLLDNIAKARKLANTSELNFSEGSGSVGIICNGVSYGYVTDALTDLNATDKVKVLRIGFSNPFPDQIVKTFIESCEKVLIAEEGEPFMEEATKAVAQENGILIPINGKGNDLFSHLYEFDPAMARTIIASYFGFAYDKTVPVDIMNVPEIPMRPPNLCAGCSHRAVFYAVKKATQDMDVMHPSDIGCYTLGFLPPLSMGDYVVCMGASTSTSGGFSTVSDKKVISYIGDSTFFHSGISGLLNGVFNNHDFTLIILDNRTTAMTGHQPNPGVDMDELNFEGYNTIDIETLIRAAGVKHVSVIKPYNIKKSIDIIREAVAFNGVSVVIAKEKCTLYAKNLNQLKGRSFFVSYKCKNHKDCINQLACPAFYVEEGTIKINADMCTGCSICAQICPEHAIIPLKK